MRRALLIMTALLLLSCETKEHATAELEGVKRAKAAATAAAQHANLGAAEEFSIPECDDYVKKYESCLSDKAPGSEEAELRRKLEEQKAAWRVTAADPDKRDALVTECKDAATNAAAALAKYGCAF